jgi:hypothetical protein
MLYYAIQSYKDRSVSAVTGPFLAIVLTGRNDELGGDLTRRFLPRLRPPLYNGATGDFVVLDCETFRQLPGFNEIDRLAGLVWT